MNFAIAGPKPLRWYVWRMSTHAASTGSRSGSSCAAGGSCATRVRTCSGCLATRASAFTAPPLLAKMSTGPASSAEIAVSDVRRSQWTARNTQGERPADPETGGAFGALVYATVSLPGARCGPAEIGQLLVKLPRRLLAWVTVAYLGVEFPG